MPTNFTRTLFAVCFFASSLFGADALPPAANVKIDFDKHIKPILANNCFSCHGGAVQQSGLRLDKRQNALRGGDYGPVIVAGKSADSKLIKKLVTGDGGLVMPPTGKLESSDIAILRAWIDQGAEFGAVEVVEKTTVKGVDPKLKQLIAAIRAQDAKSIAKLSQASLLNGQDAGGSTPLQHAAGFGTLETMKALIAKGADVNAKNRFGSTPLHWAAADVEKARLLLSKGADINAKTHDGRTALYLAASQRNSRAMLELLLEKGADANIATLPGRTPLMAAAGNGDVEAMKKLVAAKAKVSATSSTGSTALLDAAVSSNVEAVRFLLAQGSDVNAHTKRNQTALAAASAAGSEEIVALLLEKGADVHIADERGYTALMYAAYSEAMSPRIVRMLLAKGAKTDVSGEGETPKSLAAKRGDTEVARLLSVAENVRKQGGVAVIPALNEKRGIAEAVTMGLAVLEKQSPKFVRTGGCNSCHSQQIPSAAVALAKERGISAPKQIEQLPLAMVEKSSERWMDFAGVGVNSVGYEMFDYIANRRPADEYSDSVVHFIKLMQTPQGNWVTNGNRPPITFDHFVTTAMAANTLRVYGPASQKADTEKRLARAATWLESSKPVTTQERAFHLLGLAWTNASAAAIEKAARELAATQRPDGGWTQLPSMGSDAHATGQAMYALNVAGKMAATDRVYQSGVAYLMRTQARDGSWHVRTRSLPLQPYFESGFPYGHDQWISASGTAWASMALTLAVEQPRLSRR
ncbi:MAG: ankyrin repeat domain-containing protein [Candidatus Solibacter usitatus]|nr:ankyrin repeat domain-containing protein [Candidatus Solibacter usitatus]